MQQLSVAAILLPLFSTAVGETLVALRTQTATFGIDAGGSLCAISPNDGSRSYLAAGQPAPLLSLRIEGKLVAPETATWDARSKRLTLRFGTAGALAVLAVESNGEGVKP